MTINIYPPYTAVRFAANVYDVNGNLADPTTLIFLTGGPDGINYQFSAVRDTVGIYHYDFVTATPFGTWAYAFSGQGNITVQSADTQYKVQSTRFLV